MQKNYNERKWKMVDSNIYYDKNLNATTFEELSEKNQETEKVEVKFVDYYLFFCTFFINY